MKQAVTEKSLSFPLYHRIRLLHRKGALRGHVKQTADYNGRPWSKTTAPGDLLITSSRDAHRTNCGARAAAFVRNPRVRVTSGIWTLPANNSRGCFLREPRGALEVVRITRRRDTANLPRSTWGTA